MLCLDLTLLHIFGRGDAWQTKSCRPPSKEYVNEYEMNIFGKVQTHDPAKDIGHLQSLQLLETTKVLF